MNVLRQKLLSKIIGRKKSLRLVPATIRVFNRFSEMRDLAFFGGDIRDFI